MKTHLGVDLLEQIDAEPIRMLAACAFAMACELNATGLEFDVGILAEGFLHIYCGIHRQ